MQIFLICEFNLYKKRLQGKNNEGMNKALTVLLKMGITASLQDREAVIDHISALLEDKMGSDPERVQTIGNRIMTGLEALNDQLTIEQIVGGLTRNDNALEQRISDLTDAINKLNDSVQEIKTKI